MTPRPLLILLTSLIIFCGSCSQTNSPSPPAAEYTISLERNDRGTLVVTSRKATAGTLITATAIAHEGYKFERLNVVAGSLALSDPTLNPVSFPMPAGNITLSAEFSPLSTPPPPPVNSLFRITITNDGHGTALGSKEMVEEGEVVTLNAAADEGYEFRRWSVTSGEVRIADNYSPTTEFIMPAENVMIHAEFDAGHYSITVLNDGHGIALSNAAKASAGTEIILTALPDEGYYFTKWTFVEGSAEVVSLATNPLSFHMPTGNVVVKASFGQESLQIDDIFSTMDDIEFVSYCRQFDSDGNGKLSSQEAENPKSIDLSGGDIHSLKGIEYFTSLERLDCSDNQLTHLDLSKNTALRELKCANNRLTRLDISASHLLEYLNCTGNPLLYEIKVWAHFNTANPASSIAFIAKDHLTQFVPVQ